jgi:RND family efflux transporter MFP subunit
MTHPAHGSRRARAFLAALCCGASFACSHEEGGAGGAAAAAPPPPTVVVEVAKATEFRERTEITGRLAAPEEVEVRPRISGHIQEVCFQAGQIVEKDQLLFQIDPRWQEAELAHAEAELAAATARVDVAEEEFERAQQLAPDKAISQEEMQARSGRVLEARAMLAAAKAAVRTARLDLEFTQVRAPIRGRVSRPLVTAGNFVSGTAGMTTLLTTIVSTDPVFLYADLDEASFLAFEPMWNARGEDTRVPVYLQLADETGYPHEGFVESLDNKLDPSTGTILLRAQFDNPDGKLVPGLYGRAWLSVRPPRTAVLVDERAIGTDQNQKFVLVVGENDVVAYRKVELGPLIEGRRVIESGVVPGDRVIVQGQVKVHEGQPVTVATDAPAATRAGAPQPQ